MTRMHILPHSPPDQGAIANAVGWIEAFLLGSLGTTVAVVAIAGVGFAMLLGRISYRLGLRTVLGCFILFGASNIAASLVTSLGSADQPQPATSAQIVLELPRAAEPELARPPANPFDPYSASASPRSGP